VTDPYIAEIRIFSCNFAPRGWAFCQGQLLQIMQNTALFSIIGTYYGGDGKVTFGLPNLQGTVPIHQGQGPGLSLYTIGQTGGTTTSFLPQTQVPAHTHAFQASARPGNLNTPTAKTALARSDPGTVYKTPSGAATPQGLAPGTVTVTGAGIPHNNLMPYQTLNFCISLAGIYPSRG
jgi:microcystin-dependent protein